MKKYYSLIACFIIGLVLVQQRMTYPGNGQVGKQAEWDALGYYMYLPAICTYGDVKQLEWFPAIDKEYAMSGGELYQANRHENGNYVFKYLGGVALLQLPFFLVADVVAGKAGYPADGFSTPYQWAIAIAALFYCMLGFFVLRRVLLWFFPDGVVCITLLLLALATNLIQYAAVQGGMSHIYIFPLYALVLYTTIKWHRKPSAIFAILTGYIIGIATISRPTEAVMLFIPLFWNTHTKEAAREKRQQLKANKPHLVFAILGGLLGILPQLLYWKYVTGSFIYDVGSKWDFLSPHFRVLFGWEKGWFIYTPVTILFVAGFFFMKQMPFRRSVLWFCLLNILIVIAWSDWQYGASYSTRALVQSYPVFALPLAAFVQRVNATKWKWLFYTAGIYLIAVNIFQVWQYNKNILHYRDMNRKYYSRIYLNAHPTPVDMSVLDSFEVPGKEAGFKERSIGTVAIAVTAENQNVIYESEPISYGENVTEKWVRVDADIKAGSGIWGAYLSAEMDGQKRKLRLVNAITQEGQINHYTFYLKAEGKSKEHVVRLSIEGWDGFSEYIQNVKVAFLER